MNLKSLGRGSLNEVFVFYRLNGVKDPKTNAELEILTTLKSRYGRFEFGSGSEGILEGRDTTEKTAIIECDPVPNLTEKDVVKRSKTGDYYEIVAIYNDDTKLSKILVRYNEGIQDNY